MQLKGLVRFFAIALILISFYQLHFTWVVRNHESNLEAKARSWVKSNYPGSSQETIDSALKIKIRRLEDSTKDKTLTYGVTGGVSYQKAKEQELNLGLDLQGGMNVTLVVELEGLLRSMVANPKDPVFNQALQRAKVNQVNSDADFITLFTQAYKELNPNGKLSTLFASAAQKNIKLEDSDNEVIAKIRTAAEGAINNTYNVLSKRIDQFGVAQPHINLDGKKGIINVELPGVKDDPERVRKYLQATANLQFWEVYRIDELQKPLTDAESALNAYGGAITDTSVKKADTTAVAAAQKVDTSKAGTLSALLNKTTDTTRKGAAVSSNQPKRSLFSVMAPAMPQQAKNGQYSYYPYIGIVNAKDTSLLSEYLNLDVVRRNFPSNVKFIYGIPEADAKGRKDILPVYALKTVDGSDKARLEGGDVPKARPHAAAVAFQRASPPAAFGRWKIQFCHADSRPKMRVSMVSGPAERRLASIAVNASGENEARSSSITRTSSSQSVSS